MTGTKTDWLRLHLTQGLGPAGLAKVIETFGSPAAALAADPKDWLRVGIRPSVLAGIPDIEDGRLEVARQSLEEIGARILTWWDRDYPAALRTIHDPPLLLYVRGRLPGPESLAMVGSRQASDLGIRLTETMAMEVAESGITVVSGLARGIDAAAHRGALAADGLTIGVLGCGIDRVYPPENAHLFHQIAEQGGLISEYPPGAPPLGGHFPGRNRIISGLSRGVAVIEAAADSGSLITVDFALDQGREVFAVPGTVFNKVAEGVNRLLKDGAHLVTCARDILELLWPDLDCGGGTLPGEPDPMEKLTGTAREIYQLLGPAPVQADDLVRKSGLTPQILSDILLNLELQGAVEQLPGKRFVRGSKARRRSISTGEL